MSLAVPPDPYADWLKIPAERRPPTYYDLLGVPAFSQDVEQIRAAAMQRMAHVRRYQLGSRSAEAIRLLGELSLAFDTLTSEARRQHYDQSLRGRGTLSDPPRTVETLADVPLQPPPMIAPAAAPIAIPLAMPLTQPPNSPAEIPFAQPLSLSNIPVASSVAKSGEAPPVIVEHANPDLPPVEVVERPPIQIRMTYAAGRAIRRHGPKLGVLLGRLLYWFAWLILRLALELLWLPWRLVRLADRGMCLMLGRENTILHNFGRLMIMACLVVAAMFYPRVRWPWQQAEAAATPLPMLPVAEAEDAPLATVDGIALPAPSPASGTFSATLMPTPITAGSGQPVVQPASPPVASIENSIGMRLMWVPTGEFQMGSPPNEPGHNSDEQQHTVRIDKPFWMGAYEVTQQQYQALAYLNPSSFSPAGSNAMKIRDLDTSRFPVEKVSWDEAAMFCAALSSLPAEQAAGRNYRLPTEAEWEYACRAGTATPFHFQPAQGVAMANTATHAAAGIESLQRTTTVGQYTPNAFGLHDMHGNVAEWCADFFASNYYQTSPVLNPLNTQKSTARVVRGGSYLSPVADCRSARRTATPPGLKLVTNGFRVVCDAPSP